MKYQKPINCTFNKDTRDFGSQKGVSIEVKLGNLTMRNAMTYLALDRDKRDIEIDRIIENELLKWFWRHLGAA